jgi:transposase
MKDSKAQKAAKVNEKKIVVAVDVGKTMNYGYFQAPNGEEIKPFPFSNNGQGFNKFWDKLCRFRDKQDFDQIIFGFESSGPYAEPLTAFMSMKPVELVQVNPMHTKKVKELTDNSPNKTDKKDPRVIANIMKLGHTLSVVIPEGASAELRRLNQARERSKRKETVIKNQIQSLMFVIFPEFFEIMSISTKSTQYLIEHHPTPEDIIQLGKKKLSTLLTKVSRGQLGEQRAKKLYDAAQATVGIDHGKTSILIEIDHLLAQLKSEHKYTKKLEKLMSEYSDDINYSKNILSIKGIGITTVAGLLGEVGDFTKYNTGDEILKLSGLNLFEVSSGKHNGQRHITKRGRPLLRKMLYLAAVNTVRAGGIMHNKYQKMLAAGKPKIKSLVAIARKLVPIIFALVRDNTMYDENYQARNNKKMAA